MKQEQFQLEVQQEYKWAKKFEIHDPIDVVNKQIAEHTSQYLKQESITMANWHMGCMKKWVAVRDLLIADVENNKKATENQ